MKRDIFTLLESNATQTSSTGSLPVINVWRAGTVHYLMFFTLHPDKFASHYDEETKTYFLCAGDDCLACAAGLKATEHIYLPAWDIQNRRIVVLKFDTRPGDDQPAAKILRFLKSYKQQLADVVAVVKCEGGGKFTINGHKPRPEVDRGALQCQDLCRGLESGDIDLRSCVKKLSENEVLDLPSVKRAGVQVIGEEVTPQITPIEPQTPVGGPVEAAEVTTENGTEA